MESVADYGILQFRQIIVQVLQMVLELLGGDVGKEFLLSNSGVVNKHRNAPENHGGVCKHIFNLFVVGNICFVKPVFRTCIPELFFKLKNSFFIGVIASGNAEAVICKPERNFAAYAA